MKKNFKLKVKDFFKKEGFYVVLFLCLCIIATVSIVSYKVNSKNELNAEDNNKTNENELTMNQEDNIRSEIPNAERVENNTPNNEEVADTTPEAEEEETASVNAVTEVIFNNPVEGAISRGYTTTPIKYYETEDRVTYKTINGIDIKAAIGTEVKAAADGVVELVNKEVSTIGVEDGVNVIILHSNGVRTKYSNLDPEVIVNEGEKVTNGTVIGKVGASAALFRENYDEHLNLQVIDNNGEQVNPLEYFSYQ